MQKWGSRETNLPHFWPIPYTQERGEGKDFDAKISTEEVEEVKDEYSDIWYKEYIIGYY